MVGMPDAPLRIAAVSLHTSPLEEPGGADAGGMNVVVLEQSLALARAGHRVDLFTRRSDPAVPAVVEVAEEIGRASCRGRGGRGDVSHAVGRKRGRTCREGYTKGVGRY